MGPCPYRDWLKIETDSETPNHYELLGLAVFSEDAAGVRAAYEARYTQIRRYEVGNYSERASALLNELSSAFKCLTDAQEKAGYDEELREVLAARETSDTSAALHDTLVEQLDALEEIVNLEAVDDDPLGAGVLPQHDALASSTLPATPAHLAAPAGLPTSPSGNLQKPFPVWMVMCAGGAVLVFVGLLLAGATVAGIAFFSRGDRPESVVQTVLVPNASDPSTDSSEEVDSEIDGDQVTGQVTWRGRVARILVDEEETAHVLVVSPDRVFEATSSDPDLIRGLADCDCLAENAAFAADAEVTGIVADSTVSYFFPDSGLGDTAKKFAVVTLQGLEHVDDRGTQGDLSLDDKRTLSSLRRVDAFTRFAATVESTLETGTNRFQVSFSGRHYDCELPAAWEAFGMKLTRGQQVTLVVRTKGIYQAPAGESTFEERLRLEVETLDQPDFQRVQESPAAFVDQRLIYRCQVDATSLQNATASLMLTVRHAGRDIPVVAAAGVTESQASWLTSIESRAPILAEFTVARPGILADATYELASLTYLNDPSRRVVFDLIGTPKEEMPSVAEEPQKDDAPAPAFALSGLPAYLDLPPIPSSTDAPTSDTVLLNLATESTGLEVDFSSELIALDPAYAFVAKKVDSAASPQWQIFLRKTRSAGIQEAAVAHLAVEGTRLMFRWTADATRLPAGQLRNCQMQLRLGPESHQIALRTPLSPGATQLPSEANKFQRHFEVTDLPQEDALRLDVDVTYGGSRIEPLGDTHTVPRSKRLEFHIGSLQDVEIQVSLLSKQDNSLTLQALPRHRPSSNREITLSTEDVNEHEGRVRQSILKAQRSLVKANATLQTATSAFSRAKDSGTRVKFSAIVRTQQKAIVVNQKNILEMQQTLRSVGGLRSLVSGVRASTQIRFRIYAEGDASQVLLVDGGYQSLDEDVLGEQASLDATDDARSIEGVWRPSRIELGQRGMPASASYLQLENGKYSMRQGGKTLSQGRYVLTTSSTPPQITFTTPDPLLRGLGILGTTGIFMLSDDGSKLRILSDLRGATPTSFNASSTTIATIFERDE